MIGGKVWIIEIAGTWLERFGLRRRANLVFQALLAVSSRSYTYEAWSLLILHLPRSHQVNQGN
jgi:hypothetical protein